MIVYNAHLYSEVLAAKVTDKFAVCVNTDSNWSTNGGAAQGVELLMRGWGRKRGSGVVGFGASGLGFSRGCSPGHSQRWDNFAAGSIANNYYTSDNFITLTTHDTMGSGGPITGTFPTQDAQNEGSKELGRYPIGLATGNTSINQLVCTLTPAMFGGIDITQAFTVSFWGRTFVNGGGHVNLQLQSWTSSSPNYKIYASNVSFSTDSDNGVEGRKRWDVSFPADSTRSWNDVMVIVTAYSGSVTTGPVFLDGVSVKATAATTGWALTPLYLSGGRTYGNQFNAARVHPNNWDTIFYQIADDGAKRALVFCTCGHDVNTQEASLKSFGAVAAAGTSTTFKLDQDLGYDPTGKLFTITRAGSANATIWANGTVQSYNSGTRVVTATAAITSTAESGSQAITPAVGDVWNIGDDVRTATGYTDTLNAVFNEQRAKFAKYFIRPLFIFCEPAFAPGYDFTAHKAMYASFAVANSTDVIFVDASDWSDGIQMKELGGYDIASVGSTPAEIHPGGYALSGYYGRIMQAIAESLVASGAATASAVADLAAKVSSQKLIILKKTT